MAANCCNTALRWGGLAQILWVPPVWIHDSVHAALEPTIAAVLALPCCLRCSAVLPLIIETLLVWAAHAAYCSFTSRPTGQFDAACAERDLAAPETGAVTPAEIELAAKLTFKVRLHRTLPTSVPMTWTCIVVGLAMPH